MFSRGTRVATRRSTRSAQEYAQLRHAAATAPVDGKRLVLETAAVAHSSERLFVVAATWLGTHAALLNARRLGVLTRRLLARQTPAESVTVARLGALLTWAHAIANEPASLRERERAAELLAITALCAPIRPLRPLFAVSDRFPLLLPALQDRAHPLFAAWGFWYANPEPKPSAVLALPQVLRHAPELAIRAIMGPTLEADIMTTILLSPAGDTPTTVRALADRWRVSYAAAHASVDHLVARGLLVRARDGTSQRLNATNAADGLRAALLTPALATAVG